MAVRVPRTDAARLGVSVLLALAAVAPLWPRTDPGPVAPVATPAGCRLAPTELASGAPACPCEALPGRLRLLLGLPIPLATAGAGDLQALPGIGPVRAAAIVADRERRGAVDRVEELERVPGIGPATLGRLRGLVTAGPDPACLAGSDKVRPR